MSITTLNRVRSAGDERAASAPGFLLRGPTHWYESVVQLETIRCPSVGPSALLRGGGTMAVALAAAFGAYVFVAKHLPKGSADANLEELSAASAVQHEPEPGSAASVEPDAIQTTTKAAKQESLAASPRETGLDTPRLVRTERFEGDPSVWANVRKFLPWPPDQVPVLDIVPPAQPPTAAPAALDSPKAIGVPHAKPTRAHRHRHSGIRTHVPDARGRKSTAALL